MGWVYDLDSLRKEIAGTNVPASSNPFFLRYKSFPIEETNVLNPKLAGAKVFTTASSEEKLSIGKRVALSLLITFMILKIMNKEKRKDYGNILRAVNGR